MKFFNLLALIGFILLMSCIISCDSKSSDGGQKHLITQKDKYLRRELPVQRGMELFNMYCASCHNFSENGIGPNLTGITSEVNKDWLIAFINNAPQVIESGDPRAVKLFEKYKQLMPPFPTLQGEDLENILGFIHKFSEGEKRNINKRAGGIINPVVDKIPFSNLTLVLEEYLTVPANSEIAPITRINKMENVGTRTYIHDLRGTLFEIKKDRSLSEYVDISKLLPNFIDNPGKGSGFGSWAFHPEFEKNGLLYTTHTEKSETAKADFALVDSIKVTLQWVLSEWHADNPQDPSFAGTHRELLRVDMTSGAHGFQEVTFNPLATKGMSEYGLLYLAIGDGGSGLSNHNAVCSSNEHIWGSVIRVDPQGKNSANAQYGIPPDNPHVSIPNAVGEIWARGFRNPHRITWDKGGSGKMLISNIGQHSLEEVNLGIAGADYGWPNREGTFLFDPFANPEMVYPLPDDDANYTYPVAQYDHDEGSAVSGGYIYTGKNIPNLIGKYIFGDISRGTIFYTEVSDMIDGQQAQIYKMNILFNEQKTDLESIINSVRTELRLGIDAAGDIFIFSKSNGTIYKIVDCIEEPLG